MCRNVQSISTSFVCMYVCIRMKVHKRYLLCTLNADFRSPVLPRQILVPANTIVCSINVPTPTNRCISPEAYPLATPLSILPSSILFLYQLLVVFKQFIYIKKKKKKRKKERKRERKKGLFSQFVSRFQRRSNCEFRVHSVI